MLTTDVLNFLEAKRNSVLSAPNLLRKESSRQKLSRHAFKKKRREIPGRIKEFNSITRTDGPNKTKQQLRERL